MPESADKADPRSVKTKQTITKMKKKTLITTVRLFFTVVMVVISST